MAAGPTSSSLCPPCHVSSSMQLLHMDCPQVGLPAQNAQWFSITQNRCHGGEGTVEDPCSSTTHCSPGCHLGPGPHWLHCHSTPACLALPTFHRQRDLCRHWACSPSNSCLPQHGWPMGEAGVQGGCAGWEGVLPGPGGAAVAGQVRLTRPGCCGCRGCCGRGRGLSWTQVPHLPMNSSPGAPPCSSCVHDNRAPEGQPLCPSLSVRLAPHPLGNGR